MNRETVLHHIREHLKADLIDPAATRPLGEVVQAIASDLRQYATIPQDNIGITAIPLVAAFVDGDASSEEEQIVCRAILQDNSVLAEIVASLRARREQVSLPPLPQNMVDRFLEIARPLQASSDSVKAIDSVSPPSRTQEPPASLGSVAEITEAAVDSETASQELATTPSKSASLRGNVSRLLLIAGAIAAVLLIAVRLSIFNEYPISPDSEHSVTQQPQQSQTQDAMPPPDSSSEPQPEFDNSHPNERVLDQQRPRDERLLAQQEPIPLEPIESNEANRDGDLASSTPKTVSPASELSLNLPDSHTGKDFDSGKDYAEPEKRLGDLHWTKIQGLLARRQSPSSKGGESELHRWSGVELGTSISQSDLEVQTLHISTLPQSRAEGELSYGGKLVLAPDSSMALSQTGSSSGQIHIEWGAVALVDMPVGSSIEVFLEDRALTKLRSLSQSTLVLSMSSTGVLAQIDGSMECADAIFEDSLLQLGEQVEKLSVKPKIPLWVNRNVEPLNLSRKVLAQLSSSDDVAGTLEELSQKSTLAADAAVWEKLSSWVALSSGRELNQLFASGNFTQRSVAVDRLLQMPAWTNSHRRMWQSLAASSRNPEQIRTMIAFSEQLRRKRPFAATQVERLLTILENPDPATRSVADALLRRNFGGGPNYNPILPQSNNPRAITIWRRFISGR